MAVLSHPGDEAVGMGGQLGVMEDVILVHITDGAPRTRPDWKIYARTLRAEVLAAARIAGIPARRCVEAGLAANEASQHLVELTCYLTGLLADLQPDLVFTHAYEGGHPDHDAAAFAVHHAVQLQTRPPLLLIEFTSSPRNRFLNDEGAITRAPLSDEQKVLKRCMMSCLTSREFAQPAEPPQSEEFRVAPEYDFSRPPAPGPLLYEQSSPLMDGRTWRRLAGHAQRMLGRNSAASPGFALPPLNRSVESTPALP